MFALFFAYVIHSQLISFNALWYRLEILQSTISSYEFLFTFLKDTREKFELMDILKSGLIHKGQTFIITDEDSSK